jgi:hypothetical protein
LWWLFNFNRQIKMMIKLQCQNPKCKYKYEVTEAEILNDGELHKYCFLCGGEVIILNLDEIVEMDIYKKADNYLNRWFGELGIEGTIEMLERNKNNACYRIYAEILLKKGFKLK